MLDVKKCLKLKNVAVFASGVLFGTAGIKVLTSLLSFLYTTGKTGRSFCVSNMVTPHLPVSQI